MTAFSAIIGEHKMAHKSIRRLNSKLAQNPQLSEHNKEVLNEFFAGLRSSKDSDSNKKTVSSGFSMIAGDIDFRLDRPEKSDIERIVGDLNEDIITREDGKPYAIDTKETIYNALTKFYTQFIKAKGKGYNENIDGEALFEDVDLQEQSDVDINRERKATPEQVKEVADAAKNLTHEALILFGWSTGFRNCEWLITDEYPWPLKWKHIDLDNGKDMKVTCPDGKTGKRTVWVRTAKPIIEKLKKQENPDPEDPVFTAKDAEMRCPDCESTLQKQNRATYKKRKYQCPECDWQGKTASAEKYYRPLSDSAVRRVLERCYERTEISEIDINPHDFYRKSRAIFWAVEGKNESWLRQFFGWSDKTNTPRHYIELVSDDLRRGIHESYGEEYEEDFYYNEEALRPIICRGCGAQNSALWDFCENCDREITYEGLVMKEEDTDSITNEIKHETKDEIIDYLKENSSVDETEIENVMMERLNQKLEAKQIG